MNKLPIQIIPKIIGEPTQEILIKICKHIFENYLLVYSNTEWGRGGGGGEGGGLMNTCNSLLVLNTTYPKPDTPLLPHKHMGLLTKGTTRQKLLKSHAEKLNRPTAENHLNMLYQHQKGRKEIYPNGNETSISRNP